LKSKFDIKNIVEDYQTELKNVDAVIIATPPHLHALIIADCFNAGLPILCEKPITVTALEGYNILKLNTKKVIFSMCHTYRLYANRKYIKKLIKEGYFGLTPRIEIQEGSPFEWVTMSGYCFRKEMVSGGVLMDSGIHSLDFILMCLGNVKSIQYLDDSMGGIESNASMELEFENGSTAYFRISRTCDLSNKITISGNNRSITLDIFEMNSITEDGVCRGLSKEEFGDEPELDWTTIVEYQTKSFIESIEKGKPVVCSLEEGIKVVETIENCYLIKSKKALPTKSDVPGLRY
jgi:predicted dehydrogenase